MFNCLGRRSRSGSYNEAMERSLKLMGEAGEGMVGRDDEDARLKTVVVGARDFAGATRAAVDAMYGNFVAKVLRACNALRRRVDSLVVDCDAVAGRGEAAMLEVAGDAMGPALPYIIFKSQNARKTVDTITTLTMKTMEALDPLTELDKSIKQMRVHLGFDHAVSVIFAGIPKAEPADVPKMQENVKSKLASAGVLMQMPDAILEKLGVKRG